MPANRLPRHLAHAAAAFVVAGALATTGTATATAAPHVSRADRPTGHSGETRTQRRAKSRQVNRQPAKAKAKSNRGSSASVSISAPVATQPKSNGGDSSPVKSAPTATAPTRETAPVTTPVTTPTETPAAAAPESPLTPPAEIETAPVAPTSPSVPSTPSAGLMFSGAAIEDFWLNQSAPGAITEVADPAGGPEKVMKMTVSDKDVAPVTPTENPRAQLLSPDTIEPGQEFWWSGKFFLPVEGFPASVPQWLNIIEGAYGPPWNGTPPFEIEAVGKTLRWQRNGTYNWDIPWEMPLERGKWISYLVHEKLATDGFIELWINGQQINFFQKSSNNPDHEPQTTKLSMETLDQSNDGGPNFVVIQNYRKVGMFSSVTLYHGAMKLGATRASVE